MLTRQTTLSESQIREHVLPLTDGLAEVHAAGLLHRDIKPGNIMVRANGIPVLIDFGSARQAVNAKSRKLTAVGTDGYAPLEQYSEDPNSQAEATDIYALGAVLYRCVTGATPRNAPDRALEDRLTPGVEATDGVYSESLLTAIDAALVMQVNERPCDIAEFLQLVSEGDNEQAIADTFKRAKKAYGHCEREFALRVFRKLAELGHADAQYQFGEIYHGGVGVGNDEGVQWFTLAAEQGHIEAQFKLGRIQYEGVDVPKDEVQAIKWFTLAAEQGHDDAHLILDYIAAEQGDAERQYEMGRMFDVDMRDERKFDAFSDFEWYGIFDEVMTIQNCEVLAEIWYRRAAEQGHAKAQRELGLQYADGGEFVEKDLEAAIEWLTRAAVGGDADALYHVGVMYLRGEGVPQDATQAIKCVTRSAVEQGDFSAEDAQLNMRLLITLAMFHLGAGTRSFPEFSQVMTANLNDVSAGLGDKLRKHFRSQYEGARHFPGNVYAGEMSSSEEIAEYEQSLSLAFDSS